MTLLKKIKPLHIFIFFVGLHVLLLNVNEAEWGDSYRILRAAEFVRDFSYPADEKRPPLFSVLLAARPQQIDPVVWGRIFMFAVSMLSFAIFYKLTKAFFPTPQTRNLALILFTLNPVYLYWSIRIMADVPFSLLVMVGIYILVRQRLVRQQHAAEQQNILKASNGLLPAIALGFIAGLGVLTRFEGYLLFLALAVGIVFFDGISAQPKLSHFLTNLLGNFKKTILPLMLYVLTFALTIFPYLYWRNPLISTYFEEPTGRAYDLNMVAIYLISLMFVFGVIPAYFFIFRDFKQNVAFLTQNPEIGAFLILELVLILAWPAAIPRLFVAILPFLIILLAKSIFSYFSQNQDIATQTPKFIDFVTFKAAKQNYLEFTILAGFLAFYIAGQGFYKLQFLIVIKEIFILVAFLALVQISATFLRKSNIFILLTILSLFIWSLATIWIHKDLFKTVEQANLYIATNLEGTVLHNDTTSITDWYLNSAPIEENADTIYANLNDPVNYRYNDLMLKSIDYLLFTNEDNLWVETKVLEVEYFVEIAEFKNFANGAEFYTKVFKFEQLEKVPQ